MECPESPHEIKGVNPDDLPILEESGEDFQGLAIGRVIERGYEHHGVGDVKIRVARGKPLAVEFDRSRHGQGDDSQSAASLVFRGLQSIKVFLKRLMRF